MNGCCVPWYPYVMKGNKLKNKMCYPEYEEKEFKHPIELHKKYSKPDPDLLHVIRMSTEPIFGGLPLCFEEEFPHENRRLRKYVSSDDYNMTLVNINYNIDHHTPCTGWIVVYSLCVCFTCGLSCLPLCTAGKNAIEGVQGAIDEENEKIYKQNGITWTLFVRNEKKPISWIEIKKSESSKILFPDEDEEEEKRKKKRGISLKEKEGGDSLVFAEETEDEKKVVEEKKDKLVEEKDVKIEEKDKSGFAFPKEEKTDIELKDNVIEGDVKEDTQEKNDDEVKEEVNEEKEEVNEDTKNEEEEKEVIEEKKEDEETVEVEKNDVEDDVNNN